MIRSEFQVVLEDFKVPERSAKSAAKFESHRQQQLKHAATLSRLEVRRLAFRGVGLTRAELAERAGVSADTIAQGEAGRQLSDASWRKLALGLMDPVIGGQATMWRTINPQAL